MTKHCLDSRSIQEELDSLQAEVDELQEAIDGIEVRLAYARLNGEATDSLEEELAEANDAVTTWRGADDGGGRLTELERIKSDVSSSEWDSGIALVPESVWEDYVEEFVSEIGDLPREIPSYIVIDWAATADNVKEDYSAVEIDGETHYYRD